MQLKPGVWRWSQKTIADDRARKIDWLPTDTTVAELAARPRPRVTARSRRLPEEMQFVRVQAYLGGARIEADGDVHLALYDLSGNEVSLVAEIPDPDFLPATCAKRLEIEVARQKFAARFPHITGDRLIPIANCTVTVCGVVFFDKLHGQDAAAPSGIEIHPVTSITFLDEAADASTSARR